MREGSLININKQIAQQLEWTDISTEPVHRPNHAPIEVHSNRLWGYPPKVSQRRLIPDWEHKQDIAIELPINKDQQHDYGYQLALIVGITLLTNRWQMTYLIAKATAKQRCLAWLIVIRK